MLRPTPEILEAAYEYLRTTPPFRGWKLPHADSIGFVITRSKNTKGYYTKECRKPDSHEIGVSENCVSSTLHLFEVMAHEMIHLHQAINKLETGNTQHNADFLRRAKSVCKYHGWDVLHFS
jgi:hypothetical protein